MKALGGAFNQEKALVGAFSVIVQPVVEPMDHYTALLLTTSTGSPASHHIHCHPEEADSRQTRAPLLTAAAG